MHVAGAVQLVGDADAYVNVGHIVLVKVLAGPNVFVYFSKNKKYINKYINENLYFNFFLIY